MMKEDFIKMFVFLEGLGKGRLEDFMVRIALGLPFEGRDLVIEEDLSEAYFYPCIKTLVDNLTFKRNLSLRNSNIMELPKNLKVGETLDISRSKIKVIPSDISFLNLSAWDCDIAVFPKLDIEGYVDLSSSKVMKVEDGCVIRALFSLANTRIKVLPDNSHFGSLNIIATMVEDIPNGLCIDRYFHVASTPLWKKYLDMSNTGQEALERIRVDIEKRGGFVGQIY